MDIRSIDWEDTISCKLYRRSTKGGIINKGIENSLPPQEDKQHKWNVGDYCRAIYSGDNAYYEAKIINMNRNIYTVEFLGYNDSQDVDSLKLKKSKGKEARMQQIKAAEEQLSDVNSSVGESGNTTDGSIASCCSYQKKKRHIKKTANDETLDTTVHEAIIHEQYSTIPAFAEAPQFSMPMNLPSQAPISQNSVPPPPPMMPQNSIVANNPELASVLTSWYMAGYYTGKFEVGVQKHGGIISFNPSN